jgi:hypothetical protein
MVAVVSILLSSSIPSAILNDGILSCPIPFHEITKYGTSLSANLPNLLKIDKHLL